MLFGGLRRDGSETGAIVNYVFPSLHGMKQESVAASLTKMIKKYVKANMVKSGPKHTVSDLLARQR